jgi:hypothetical protein
MRDRSKVCQVLLIIPVMGGLLTAGGCSMFQSSPSASSYPPMPAPEPVPAVAVDRKPTATFPATVAVVRVETPKLPPNAPPGYGQGAYKVVFTRNVEKPEVFERLAKLPMVASLETMSRLELPDGLTNEQALRTAAVNDHCNLLMIYRFDDSYDDRDTVGWKTIVTAGIAPTKRLIVTSTASAVLVDSHTGFLYGSIDASSDKSTVSSCWAEDAAADSSRQDAEAAAFERLVPEMEKAWGKVITKYATTKPD